jgi:hypothetical protein
MNPKIIFALVLMVSLSAHGDSVGLPITPKSLDFPNPSNGTDIPITFAKPLLLPKPARLPRETEFSFDKSAREPGGQSLMAFHVIKDPKEHGPLSTLPLGRITALQATWADPHFFHTEVGIQGALKELLTNSHEMNYTYHAWQYADPDPTLVVAVEYASGKQGAWWIWLRPNVAWAFEDENGQWWWGLWDGSDVPGKKAPLPASLKEED